MNIRMEYGNQENIRGKIGRLWESDEKGVRVFILAAIYKIEDIPGE